MGEDVQPEDPGFRIEEVGLEFTPDVVGDRCQETFRFGFLFLRFFGLGCGLDATNFDAITVAIFKRDAVALTVFTCRVGAYFVGVGTFAGVTFDLTNLLALLPIANRVLCTKVVCRFVESTFLPTGLTKLLRVACWRVTRPIFRVVVSDLEATTKACPAFGSSFSLISTLLGWVTLREADMTSVANVHACATGWTVFFIGTGFENRQTSFFIEAKLSTGTACLACTFRLNLCLFMMRLSCWLGCNVCRWTQNYHRNCQKELQTQQSNRKGESHGVL